MSPVFHSLLISNSHYSQEIINTFTVVFRLFTVSAKASATLKVLTEALSVNGTLEGCPIYRHCNDPLTL